ncbi:MAG: Fic family protein, partial [Halorhodospira sp.]
ERGPSGEYLQRPRSRTRNFKQHRERYYELLDDTRTRGDWESWLAFFLEGVQTTAASAVHTAERLVTLFQEDKARIEELGRSAPNTLRVFEVFRSRPITTIREVRKRTGLSAPTAGRAVGNLEALGIVEELTGRRRDRVYAYRRYIAILNEGGDPL